MFSPRLSSAVRAAARASFRLRSAAFSAVEVDSEMVFLSYRDRVDGSSVFYPTQATIG